MIHRKSSALSLRRFSPVTRPASTARLAAAAPASTAASRPASSAAGGLAGGFLAVLLGWAALFGLLVVMPIGMLLSGAEPAAVLGWMMMVAVAMAISCFLDGRRQAAELRRMPKPRRPTSPCAEEFQRRWGTTESSEAGGRSAPGTTWMRLSKWAARWGAGKAEAAPASPAESVPAFVVNELPGVDGVYNARVYTLVDAFADTMAEADRLGLTGEDRIEALASVLRGAKPYSSKAPARQGRVSGGGAGGGPQGGRGSLISGWKGVGRVIVTKPANPENGGMGARLRKP